MTPVSDVTNADILHHIANSVEHYFADEDSLSFGTPWVQNGRLAIKVTDDDDNSRTWILQIKKGE